MSQRRLVTTWNTSTIAGFCSGLLYEWICGYFKGSPPPGIWQVLFYENPQGAESPYTMVLHRYARNEQGSRHAVWVKENGPQGFMSPVRLVACEEPEEYPLHALPPEELL